MFWNWYALEKYQQKGNQNPFVFCTPDAIILKRKFDKTEKREWNQTRESHRGSLLAWGVKAVSKFGEKHITGARFSRVVNGKTWNMNRNWFHCLIGWVMKLTRIFFQIPWEGFFLARNRYSQRARATEATVRTCERYRILSNFSLHFTGMDQSGICPESARFPVFLRVPIFTILNAIDIEEMDNAFS